MRKIVFICLIFLIVFTTSCSKKYEVLEYGTTESIVSGANHTEDIKLRKKAYTRMAKGTQKTVTIDGKDFEMLYEESYKGYYYNDDVDAYTNDSREFYIEINNKTGNIDFYAYIPKDYMSTVADTTKKLSEEECKKIAIEYFGKYVNIEEYQFVESFSQQLRKYDTYVFYFQRVIDGIETLDGGCVGVTEYGDVYMHNFDCLGLMENVKVPTDDKLKTIDNCVDEKIKSIYEDISDTYEISYDIYSKILVRFEKGKYALQYVVDVTLKNSAGEDWSESTTFYVYL